MLLVTCKIGGEHVWVAPEDANRDPHLRLDEAGCTHCLDGHGSNVHCREAADACPKTHGTPCWSGPNSGPRPDGCTVCRPVLVEIPRGTTVVTGAV